MFIRQTPAEKALGSNDSPPCLSLYGMHNYPALASHYDGFDGGLAGLKLKSIVKAVAAPVQAAVKAVAPVVEKVVDAHKIVIASAASAVGVKAPAQKALGLNEKQMKLANKLGVAQKVVAGTLIGAAAAPAILSTTGAAAAKAAALAGKAGLLTKAVPGLIQKGMGLLGGLKKAKPEGETVEGEEGPGLLHRATTAIGKEAKRFKTKAAGGINTFLGAPKSTEKAPAEEGEDRGVISRASRAVKSEGQRFARRATEAAQTVIAPPAFQPAPINITTSTMAPSAPGGMYDAPAAPPAPPPNPLTEAGAFNGFSLNDPKTLLIGAGLSLAFFALSRRGGSRRR